MMPDEYADDAWERRFEQLIEDAARRINRPQDQVVTFCLDAETLALLRERAARGPSSLDEVIREILRLGFFALAEDEWMLTKVGATGWKSEEDSAVQ